MITVFHFFFSPAHGTLIPKIAIPLDFFCIRYHCDQKWFKIGHFCDDFRGSFLRLRPNTPKRPLIKIPIIFFWFSLCRRIFTVRFLNLYSAHQSTSKKLNYDFVVNLTVLQCFYLHWLKSGLQCFIGRAEAAGTVLGVFSLLKERLKISINFCF